MTIIERYRIRRTAARRRAAIERAISANPSHTLRHELETLAARC